MLIVQKYGGTSVGTVDRIRRVAERVLETQKAGNQVVVVVSAMAGETNRLVSLAKQINPHPYSKEYDTLVASGEQVSVGLLSLAINTLAGRSVARPLLGYQIGMRTSQVYSKARIEGIDSTRLNQELDEGRIPVIAGFQGVDLENNITTLGRGGSDTSAVAIAAAVNADDCEIYTDVDGVYTTDPRVCSAARKIDRISYEEMMEFAGLGAKVLQIRSVELAAKYQVPIHVRSSFETSEGTRVVAPERLGKAMEQVVVSGVASEKAQVKITLQEVDDCPGVAAKVFGALSKNSVVVDVIVQDVSSNGKLTISFTVAEPDLKSATDVLSALKKESGFGSMAFNAMQGLSKVSVIGVGMQHHPGVASKMFELLGQKDINIELITTSEIKISCLIDGNKTEAAVNALHGGFGLDQID